MPIRIFAGVKPALEALRQEEFVVRNAYCTKLPQELNDYAHLMKGVSHQFLDKLAKVPDIHHQGVVVEVDIPLFSIEDLDDERSVLLLDHITDPQNLGNMLRSAAFFNFQAIIVPNHGSVNFSPLADRISAGGSLYVKLIEVANLKTALEKLAAKGFWSVATSEHAEESAEKVLKDANHPWAVLIGSEGEGVSSSLMSKADFKVKIETNSPFTTLNAATAAAVMMTYAQKGR